jgi:hypothetical protein
MDLILYMLLSFGFAFVGIPLWIIVFGLGLISEQLKNK